MKSNRFPGMAAIGIGLLMAGSALAQNAQIAVPQSPDGPDVFFEAVGPGPGGPPDVIGFVSFEGGVNGKTVTGAPFTASFSTQTTQTLVDGNQIQRSATGSIARDSQGRTRRDTTLPAIGPWAAAGKPAPQFSFINDPVSGTQYTLDADRKVARKTSTAGHNGHEFGKRALDGPLAEERQKETTTTSLGTQTVNGVSAQGTRITRTIPAGEIGNQKPIVITIEKWYSPDLQETVMTKRSDPRMGETVFQLTNIQRTEPAATLFQVPAGFSVEEGRGHVRGMYRTFGPAAGASPDAPVTRSPTP